MVGAVAEKNQKKALELYYDLLTLKEPPMRILFLIARQFNILLQVKELRRKGAGPLFGAALAFCRSVPSLEGTGFFCYKVRRGK